MLPSVTAFFVLLFAGTGVIAQSHDVSVSSLAARQSPDSPSPDCNATCAAFGEIKNSCQDPKCGCNTKYLQAQGDCLVCQTETPTDAASVQLLLDAEINQCHSDGIPISFKLKLSPEAQAIVDEFDRQSNNLKANQMVFLALQIAGGHVGLVIVLGFAIFSRKVRRDPTFLNFCITWIFSSVMYSILLYRGTEGNTIANSLGSVSPNTCLAQAALTNGAQVMTACSTMALVIQLWIGLRKAIHGDIADGARNRQFITILLLAAPYVLFFAFAIPSVLVGRVHTVIDGTSLQRVLPTNFYCSIIELSSFLRAIYAVTLALLIITAVFDGLIIVILYRHWRAFRHIQTKSAVSLSILLRVLAFSIYRVVVAVAYGTVLDAPPQVFQAGSGEALSIQFGVPIWVDMLQGAIPLVGFIVLGVNTDMLHSLMFWRRNNRALSTMHSINTESSNSSVSSSYSTKKLVDDHSTYQDTWEEKGVLGSETRHAV